MRRFPHTRLALAIATLAAGGAAAQSEPPQRVEIIGTSPLPGQGIDRDLLPYNTQLLRRDDIDAAQATNATDLLSRRAAGVNVGDIQGSPYQGDLTFRGFRASGLLGAGQGISVYLDGVRVNEPFGDVVNWDMIPEFALASIAIVPGANPGYGLNTLGGAIAMTTLDGRSAPGWRAEATLGSFARRRLDMSHGGSDGDWQHFVAAGAFAEDGWRDHSAGHLATILAKVSRRTEVGEFGLSVLGGKSKLIGNGLLPLDTLGEDGERTPDLGRADFAAVYTYPDLTRNDLAQLSGTWRLALDGDSTLEALLFLRDAERTTINGDEAEEEGEEEEVDESGMVGRPRALAEGDAEANATFNRTATTQRSYGAALGWSGRRGAHQLHFSANVDRAEVAYEQTEQAGVFDASRGVLPIEGEEAELSVRVRGHSVGAGLNASDTWQLAAGTHLTGTLRYNRVRVTNTLSTLDEVSAELEPQAEESFTYSSLNPALGLAQRVGAATVFANVARNTRVPTVIELGCADPEEPCRLPVGLQADPYLEQVRSTTVEAGARWRGRAATAGMDGSVTLYRTDNRDDILFSSVSIAGQLGYFRNFDRTRHQGLDAEWNWRTSRLDLALAYSYLDATYQAEGTLRIGERNVVVHPGTRIAGLPRHSLKVSADWRIAPWLTIGGDVQAFDSRGTSGNEDALIEDDGDEQVDLSLPGFAVVNVRAGGDIDRHWSWFAGVANVFDRQYANVAAVGETVFDAAGNFTGEGSEALFVGPGAPRAFSVGVRLKY